MTTKIFERLSCTTHRLTKGNHYTFTLNETTGDWTTRDDNQCVLRRTTEDLANKSWWKLVEDAQDVWYTRMTTALPNITKGKAYRMAKQGKGLWITRTDDGVLFQVDAAQLLNEKLWKIAKPPRDESGPHLWDEIKALKRIKTLDSNYTSYRFTLYTDYPIRFTTTDSLPYVVDDKGDMLSLESVPKKPDIFWDRWEIVYKDDDEDYVDLRAEHDDKLDALCATLSQDSKIQWKINHTPLLQPKEPTMAIEIKKTTLINGKDVDEWSAKELMALISKLLEEKEALDKLDFQVSFATDTQNDDGYLPKQIKLLNKQITKLAALLDAK